MSQARAASSHRRPVASALWRLLGVSGACLILTAVLAASALALSAGDLDGSFSDDGKLTTDFGASVNKATALAIQADGKIVAAGFSRGVDSGTFALARYNPDGSLDPSFSGDGQLTTSFGKDSVDNASGVAIQADGRIVAGGASTASGNWDFALARYNPDGSLDTSFSGDGKLTTGFGVITTDTADALAIQADGRIVLAGGRTTSEGATDFALARYNSDGSLDPSFSGDGKQTTDFGASGENWARDVAIQTDGRIVASGTSGAWENAHFALARYSPDGSLDGSFSGDGKQTTGFGGEEEQAVALAIQADGRIVAAGTTVLWNGSTDFALARFNPDGSLDGSFDADGKLTTDIGKRDDVDHAHAVAIQPDGQIVAAGDSFAFPNELDFALARYNPDGSLDTSFAGDGTVTTNFESRSADSASAVAIQADEKIVTAGDSGGLDPEYFALARYRGGTPPETVIDIAGNTDPGPASATFTVDTTPPRTRIKKVKVNSEKRKAKIFFEGSEPAKAATALRFKCKLDRKKYRRCTSPRTYKRLKVGRRKIKVRAIDAAGNRDSTPAKRTFEVKRSRTP